MRWHACAPRCNGTERLPPQQERRCAFPRRSWAGALHRIEPRGQLGRATVRSPQADTGVPRTDQAHERQRGGAQFVLRPHARMRIGAPPASIARSGDARVAAAAKARQSSRTHACACRARAPALTFAVATQKAVKDKTACMATQTAFNLYIYIYLTCTYIYILHIYVYINVHI